MRERKSEWLRGGYEEGRGGMDELKREGGRGRRTRSKGRRKGKREKGKGKKNESIEIRKKGAGLTEERTAGVWVCVYVFALWPADIASDSHRRRDRQTTRDTIRSLKDKKIRTKCTKCTQRYFAPCTYCLLCPFCYSFRRLLDSVSQSSTATAHIFIFNH